MRVAVLSEVEVQTVAPPIRHNSRPRKIKDIATFSPHFKLRNY